MWHLIWKIIISFPYEKINSVVLIQILLKKYMVGCTKILIKEFNNRNIYLINNTIHQSKTISIINIIKNTFAQAI